MRTFLLSLFCAAAIAAHAQQTYDLLTFTAPKGWERADLENVVNFTAIDNDKRVWARIIIYKSTTSMGSIEADFEKEWKELAVKPYKVADRPLGTETQNFNGWDIVTGLGKFLHNGDSVAMLLNTFSDGTRCTSLILMSNTTTYGTAMDAFLESIKLQPATPKTTAPVADVAKDVKAATPPTKAPASRYKYNTTNFDDGWTSVIGEDWVEVTKGAAIVRLHYPNAEANIIGDPEPRIAHAWNKLVAPRYSNIENYRAFSTSLDYQRPYLGTATLTNQQGKRVYIALFQKASDDWTEVELPSKGDFIKMFGFDPDALEWGVSSDIWKPLLALAGYNRFAIGENDLTGTWSSDFSGSTQYYSSYTGTYAGYSAYQSNETFVFGPGNTYTWKILGIQSVNGQSNAQQAQSAGTYKFNSNWQIHFSKIEKGPKVYDAYFSAFKGGRLLWMKMADYGGYSRYGLVK